MVRYIEKEVSDMEDMQREGEDDKYLLLEKIFPKMCPDWLKNQIDEIIKNCAGGVVDEDEKKDRIEKMFWMKVEDIFSLSSEELESLPGPFLLVSFLSTKITV